MTDQDLRRHARPTTPRASPPPAPTSSASTSGRAVEALRRRRARAAARRASRARPAPRSSSACSSIADARRDPAITARRPRRHPAPRRRDARARQARSRSRVVPPGVEGDRRRRAPRSSTRLDAWPADALLARRADAGPRRRAARRSTGTLAREARRALPARQRRARRRPRRPSNVAEAIATVEPWAVDVASGVEARPASRTREARRVRRRARA